MYCLFSTNHLCLVQMRLKYVLAIWHTKLVITTITLLSTVYLIAISNQRTTVKFTINYGMIIYTLQLGSGRWGYELALRYCLIYYLAQLQTFVVFFHHALQWIVLMLLVIITKYFIAMKLLQIPLLVYELLNESNIACLFTVVCYYNLICSI